MKSLIKYSLLALLSAVALETITLQQAHAGSDPAGVTVPDSSATGVNFAPPAPGDTSTTGGSLSPSVVLSQPAVVAAVSNAVSTVRASLQADTVPAGAVAGVQPQPLSPEAVEAVSAILTATSSNVATVAPALSSQISSEISSSLGGGSVSTETATALSAAAKAVADLSISAANLPEAIVAVNALVQAAYANGELTALAKSPSFVAAHQAVAQAVEAAGGAANSEESSEDNS